MSLRAPRYIAISSIIISFVLLTQETRLLTLPCGIVAGLLGRKRKKPIRVFQCSTEENLVTLKHNQITGTP